MSTWILLITLGHGALAIPMASFDACSTAARAAIGIEAGVCLNYKTGEFKR